MDPRRWPEWFCETGSAVFPSFCPSVLPSVRVYSWNCIISFFLNFGTVLEIYMKLCVTEADFPEKNFLLRKLGKWTKNGPKTGFFEFIEKFCHYLLLTLPYDEIYFICCKFLHKFHIWENFCSWDMGQNVLRQSDCKIFQSTISLEQINEIAWFFVCLYKFT